MTAAPGPRPPRPTTLEIDLDAAAANVRAEVVITPRQASEP